MWSRTRPGTHREEPSSHTASAPTQNFNTTQLSYQQCKDGRIKCQNGYLYVLHYVVQSQQDSKNIDKCSDQNSGGFNFWQHRIIMWYCRAAVMFWPTNPGIDPLKCHIIINLIVFLRYTFPTQKWEIQHNFVLPALQSRTSTQMLFQANETG